MSKPAPLEVAPFIMRDHHVTPSATEKALREGMEHARYAGDDVEADRIEKHLGDAGPTGLKYAHRPKTYDPIELLITDPRLKHAADSLRRAAEGVFTGRSVVLESYKPPKDPEVAAEDLLPAIKNPPTPPDPKNRWTTAKRTLDINGNKVDCPPTWPPKPVKRGRGMPKQFIAEAIFSAIHTKRDGDRRTRIWRVCLDTFETWRMREAIWGIIIERRSLTWACKYTGLAINGRHKRIVKQNLVAALDRVAQHLDEGA